MPFAIKCSSVILIYNFPFSLEQVFYDNGVDIVIQGHEHSYERLWPVYNETVMAKNYSDPKAPVHIISGAAGCNELDGLCLDPILRPRGEIMLCDAQYATEYVQLALWLDTSNIQ